MQTISAVLYFLSHHPGWSFLLLALFFGALSIVTKKWIFGILALLMPIANIFLAHMLNAWFLNAYGVKGTGIVTLISETNSTLNDNPIYDYDVLVKTPDGQDVLTGFSTMSAAIYPVRNAILLPPANESFVLKYIPGCEKNIVVLSDESAYGLARIVYENKQLVEKARIQYEASRNNGQFKEEYKQALKTFIADPDNLSDDIALRAYREVLQSLE
ncbi:hypothetical protein [Chitinophaga sp. Ak27]|uniref:hypothetical protein n=1 Tax=Chitinophaga sp. Ak27 TaxID=2726116 RepID=UPI00145EC110|nr:hypothetical protein [Chitinophaga sp. Ak27]NLU96427.1 hypothetical protein [Chitinophaga sp. Ak27]